MNERNQRLVWSVLHPTDFSKASDLAFAQALAISLLGNTTLTILHAGPEKEKDVDWSSFPPVRKTLERWRLLKPDSPKTGRFGYVQRSREKNCSAQPHANPCYCQVPG